MKFTVLYDNSSQDPSFQSGWGFSCLVDGRILFDTGEAPGPLFSNMEQLQINPSQIEAVVISHNHWDHTGGLWELLKKRKGLKVYGCPGFGDDFRKKVVSIGGTWIESAGFKEIDREISVTGEIPGQYKGASMPEQALIAKTKNGIAVITGCSHPGIITIIGKARYLFPKDSISLIMGGFHLKDENPETIGSIAAALMQMGVLKAAPTHCSGEKARAVFHKHFGKNYIWVGAGSRVEV